MATISVPLGSLSLTGYAPEVNPNVYQIPSETLTLTGHIPRIHPNVIDVPLGTITLTGNAPSVYDGDANTYTSMFIHGREEKTDYIAMYAVGGLSISGNAPLSALGHYSLNSFLTAAMVGAVSINSDTTVFTKGMGLSNKVAYLSIEGWIDSLNSYAPLFIQTGTTGTFGTQSSIPLHMATPKKEEDLFLFIKNTETEVAIDHSIYLSIKVEPITTDGDTITMYLQNDAIGSSFPMYVRADGFWENYVPFGEGMNLFINRENTVAVTPLFLKALDDGSNSYLTMHIVSYLTSSGSTTLAIPEVKSEGLNTYARLYTEGSISITGAFPSYMYGHGEETNSTSLVVKQGSGFPNSYSDMFVKGAYLDNNSMTLVMPTVVESSPQNSLPIYILGW